MGASERQWLIWPCTCVKVVHVDDSKWSSGSSSNQILFIAKCFSVFDNRTGAMPVSGNQISLFLSLLERELLKREVLVSDAKNSDTP